MFGEKNPEDEVICLVPGLGRAGYSLRDPCALSTLSLVSFVISSGIFFEHFCIGFLDSHAKGKLAPLVHVLLSELTLMGGMGLVTFFIGKTGSLKTISQHIFHDDLELNEMLENIHMILFLIIVIFLAEALFLIMLAKRQERHWKTSNNASVVDPKGVINRYSAHVARKKGNVNKNIWFEGKIERDASFLAIRVRFLSMCKLSGLELGPDFPLDQYLGSVYGKAIGGLVDIPVRTFFSIWMVFSLSWFLHASLSPQMYTLSVIVMGWILSAAAILLLLKLRKIQYHITPELIRKHALEKHSNTVEAFNGGASDCPLLTRDDTNGTVLSKYISNLHEIPHHLLQPPYIEHFQTIEGKAHLKKFRKKSLFSKLLAFVLGAKTRFPNKHEALFWEGASGPQLLQFLTQILLSLIAVYLSYLFIALLPAIFEVDENTIGLTTLSARIAVAFATVLPILPCIFFAEEIVQLLVLVTCLEYMIDKTIVTNVKVAEKKVRAVRALKLLRGVRREVLANYNAGAVNNNRMETRGQGKEDDDLKAEDKKLRADWHHVFDSFDIDGNGEISHEEFFCLLEALNLCDSEEEAENIKNVMDQDNNGSITFNEFFHWATLHCKSDAQEASNENIETTVDVLFSMLDEDKSGTITHTNFKLAMKRMHIDFSDADAKAIMDDVDKDGDGVLNKEELKMLLTSDLNHVRDNNSKSNEKV
eukprot:g4246.t1